MSEQAEYPGDYLISLRTYMNEAPAKRAKEHLAEAGVYSVITGDGLRTNVFGQTARVTLFVSQADEQRAIETLATLEYEEDTPEEEAREPEHIRTKNMILLRHRLALILIPMVMTALLAYDITDAILLLQHSIRGALEELTTPMLWIAGPTLLYYLFVYRPAAGKQ